jgi:hypothetical protein
MAGRDHFGEKNPFFGKRHTKETKEKISQARRNLSREEVTSLALDYVYFDDSFEELAKNYGIERERINHYTMEARKKNIISTEQFREAMKRRFKGLQQGRFKNKTERDSSIVGDYLFFDESGEEIKKIYGVKHLDTILRRAIKKGLMTEEQYTTAKHRRLSNLRTGVKKKNPPKGRIFTPEQRKKLSEINSNPSEEVRRKMSASAIARLKRECKNRYHVKNRFYAASLGEGATALLLEEYLPNFKIIEGETFQANGDTRCLYDFVTSDEIIEWHPIYLERDGKKLLPEDLEAYQELKREHGTARPLAKGFMEDLSVEYWMRRQEASDNSEVYKGKEVELLRNERELYNFLSERNSEMPPYTKFRKQFKELKEKVRSYKVQPKQKTLTEKCAAGN